jgi:hypothetical protein
LQQTGYALSCRLHRIADASSPRLMSARHTMENGAMTRFFDILKFLLVPFTFLALYFIIRGSFINPNLEDVGFGVLSAGIAFGFGSMSDMTKISKSEEKLFNNKTRYRWTVAFYLTIGFLLFAATILFISQRWIIKSDIGTRYFQLGLNCFPLVIAVFFSLKQLIDKQQYYILKSAI